jgi:hypothetical protein
VQQSIKKGVWVHNNRFDNDKFRLNALKLTKSIESLKVLIRAGRDQVTSGKLGRHYKGVLDACVEFMDEIAP